MKRRVGSGVIPLLPVILIALFCIYWASVRSILIDRFYEFKQNYLEEAYIIEHSPLSFSGFPLQFTVQTDKFSMRASKSNDLSVGAERMTLETLSLWPFEWSLNHIGDMRVDMRGPRRQRWLFDIRPAAINMDIDAGFSGIRAFRLQAFRLRAQSVIGTLPPVIRLSLIHI